MLTFAVFQLVTALVGGTVGVLPLAYVFSASMHPVSPALSQRQMQTFEREALRIELRADGQIMVAGAPTSETGLLVMLAAKAGRRPAGEVRILLSGEPGVGYPMVKRVMEQLAAAGYAKVGLVTSEGIR